MTSIVYDGSFAGLLTAIFDIYEYKFADVDIVTENQQRNNIFGSIHTVHTDEAKSLRVWNGLKKHISPTALTAFYKTSLCEEAGMENMLAAYARYAFSGKAGMEDDYSHPAVQYVISTAKKVHREKHRMEAFVRFSQSTDGLYFATVEPDFNVLPLIITHFKKRYADQRWMIYDAKRKYGIYYDLHTVQFVEISPEKTMQNEVSAITIDETEPHYQQLWRTYFASVNIAARKNMKLHIRHMPYRYWKHLTEKQL